MRACVRTPRPRIQLAHFAFGRLIGLTGGWVAFLGAVTVGPSRSMCGRQAETRDTHRLPCCTTNVTARVRGYRLLGNPPRQGFESPPLIGDAFAFVSDLRTRSEAHAVSLEGTCTVARGGSRSEGPCYGVSFSKGGELMGMAHFTFFGNASTHVVIVGGTGVYQGVTGEVLSVSRGQNGPYSTTRSPSTGRHRNRRADGLPTAPSGRVPVRLPWPGDVSARYHVA
jgi:hypothetical protein